MIVTGIGSRQTPPDVLVKMTRIGAWCREHHIPLRSGHAEGADWAFEFGAQELCIAYLPWKGFNKHLKSAAKKPVVEQTVEVTELIRQVHAAPEKLSSGAWKLHGRNVFQILGSTLNKPSTVVVCWTINGAVKGGTATAIRLAQGRGIPVYNLAVAPFDQVMSDLNLMLRRVDSDAPLGPG